MIRTLVALSAFGLAVYLVPTLAAGQADKFPKNTCVEPCKECAKSCAEMMKHARDNKMEGLAVEVETCHHMCLTCALAVEHKKPHSWATCELCEKWCNECAIECDKAGEHGKKCADMCRKCAKACADARK